MSSYLLTGLAERRLRTSATTVCRMHVLVPEQTRRYRRQSEKICKLITTARVVLEPDRVFCATRDQARDTGTVSLCNTVSNTTQLLMVNEMTLISDLIDIKPRHDIYLSNVKTPTARSNCEAMHKHQA